MSQYFPEPCRSFGGNINVKVDLSNYATKADLKNLTHADTLSFALKPSLASLKTEFDKLDIDKLAPVLVNNIDTSGFVLKTKCQTDKSELEKKVPDGSDLVKKSKLTELENKILDVSGLATKTALTAVENKIPDVSSLVKKTNYDTKISELEKKLTDHNHDKYITTPEFNTLAADVFNARLAQANLITKTDFDAKMSRLNRKITSNKTKHLLVENELKKLKSFDLGYFIGKSHFDEDGTQHYLVFRPILRYFTLNSNCITEWKSKELSNESLEVVSTTGNTLTPSINYYEEKVRLRFTGSVLWQKAVIYSHKKNSRTLSSL